jgi:hypothetical protein
VNAQHLIVPVIVDCNEEVPGEEGGHAQKVEHQPHGAENQNIYLLNIFFIKKEFLKDRLRSTHVRRLLLLSQKIAVNQVGKKGA